MHDGMKGRESEGRGEKERPQGRITLTWGEKT